MMCSQSLPKHWVSYSIENICSMLTSFMFRCNSFVRALSLQRHHSTCRMIAFSHCPCTNLPFQLTSPCPTELVPPGVEDMTVNEGDTVSLSCDSSTSTGIVAVQWRGPDGEVITNTLILIIPDIQRNQFGVYTCFITNINGKTISGNGTVTVQCECAISKCYMS